MKDGEAVAEAVPPAVPAQVPMAALTGLPIALVLTNPALEDNPIVYANAAFTRLTGYTIEAAVGRNCRFLQGPETEPEAVAEIREALRSGNDVSVEITNHRADGSTFVNRLTITPVTDRGELTYYLGTLGDRDADERELEAVRLQLREVQHRVKNHLAMIGGLVRMQARSPQAQDDYVLLARRIEALQLLYQELSDSGVSSMGHDEVPLGAYVSRIAAAIAHLDGSAGIRVNVAAEEVIVDATTAGRVGLLLSEVLTNAFRHAFRGRETGLVETRLQRLSGGIVRIQVADDGIGLPADHGWPKRGNLGSRIVDALLTGLNAKHAIATSAEGTTITIDLPAPGAGQAGA